MLADHMQICDPEDESVVYKNSENILAVVEGGVFHYSDITWASWRPDIHKASNAELRYVICWQTE